MDKEGLLEEIKWTKDKMIDHGIRIGYPNLGDCFNKDIEKDERDIDELSK